MKENNEVVNANKPIENQTLVERLRIRANIRRNNTERKSVKEGKPDRIRTCWRRLLMKLKHCNRILKSYIVN